MTKFTLLCLSVGFANAAIASLHVSIKYPLSLGELHAIKDKITEAKNRPEDLQELLFVSPLGEKDQKRPISISCGAKSPDGDGNGCKLHFYPKKKEAEFETFSLNIFKGVNQMALEAKIGEIENKLKATAPVEAHLNFGNPFATTGDGVNYFCQPEGPKPAKEWRCYLDVTSRH